ncbi:hypothetical protein KM043_012443 [Ampulex compressa]|nr:hypothetical protein KM043_012443 [Ampulex compressa]
MSVGSGGRAPFKRATTTTTPITRSTKSQPKPEPKLPLGSGRKKDVVSSLFSTKRPPAGRKVERSARPKPKSEDQLKTIRSRRLYEPSLDDDRGAMLDPQGESAALRIVY